MIGNFMAGKILLTFFMTLCAFLDFKDRAVSVYIFIYALIAEFSAYAYMLLTGYSIEWTNLLTGMLPGILLLFISIVSAGRLGIGDAIYFFVTGIAAGVRDSTLILSIGMLIAALYGTFRYIITLFGGSNKICHSFPLLPAMLPAGIMVLFFL